VIREATRRSEPVAFSAVTLLEIANLFSGAKRIKGTVGEFFGALKADPVFEALPITIEIAALSRNSCSGPIDGVSGKRVVRVHSGFAYR
jgi:hypothetical protein